MADGIDRILGATSSKAEEILPGYAVSCDSSPNAIGVTLIQNNPIQINLEHCGSIPNRQLQLTAAWNPDQVSIDKVLDMVRALWEGAESKGWPDPDWKH